MSPSPHPAFFTSTSFYLSSSFPTAQPPRQPRSGAQPDRGPGHGQQPLAPISVICSLKEVGMFPHTPPFPGLEGCLQPGEKDFQEPSGLHSLKRGNNKRPAEAWLLGVSDLPCPVSANISKDKSYSRAPGAGRREGAARNIRARWTYGQAPCADESQAHTIEEDSRMLACPWQEPPHLHQSAPSMSRE